eukprot:GHVQ01013581.1.p1 GENE.GHVQ01013581.1~~GHVQ01013581.1.p1  ORF type:complete len:109 (+),score=12.19 GHVQ01013581.1:764-1090(+)
MFADVASVICAVAGALATQTSHDSGVCKRNCWSSSRPRIQPKVSALQEQRTSSVGTALQAVARESGRHTTEDYAVLPSGRFWLVRVPIRKLRPKQRLEKTVMDTPGTE